MKWEKLLDSGRLKRPDDTPQKGRSPFQQDLDRIVFSAAFRRLAHKTQVHPLSANDNVHTRLTHSIEVASVGRSLGTIVGTEIAPKLKQRKITSDTFGYIVQAACLAHDIGNPPFGHSGEDAIKNWYRENHEVFGDRVDGPHADDLRNFEGNAQGFRILTQLENYKWQGGLQLTHAVLATFSKYPRSSSAHVEPDHSYPGGKKIGFFESEREYFDVVAKKVGLKRRKVGEYYWSRHPLTFLVEAADDICYAIIDIEDGYELGYLTFDEARDILAPIAGPTSEPMEPREIIAKLRAVAIGEMISEVASVFVDNEKKLLMGSFSSELVKLTKFAPHIERALSVANRKIYWSERKTKLEIAGSEVIQGLLGIFSVLAHDIEEKKFDLERLAGRNEQLARLVGPSLRGVKDRYDVLMRINDFISGMTDRFAVELYRNLKGIST